jgi:hypothetical protein
VLGIWWKRTTTTGAIAGIIAGWGICLFYLVVSRHFPQMGVKASSLSPPTFCEGGHHWGLARQKGVGFNRPLAYSKLGIV